MLIRIPKVGVLSKNRKSARSCQCDALLQAVAATDDSVSWGVEEEERRGSGSNDENMIDHS